MCAVLSPFVQEHSMRLPAIQALRNIFLQSYGIWGWGRDYPVQGDAGWQGGSRRVEGRVGWGTVGVCVCSAGGCVWRQQGRLSLVGGGMVKCSGLPSLSYHQGCESQIKLSVLFPFFRLTFTRHSSISLFPVFVYWVSPSSSSAIPSTFYLGPHGFLFVYILAPRSCSSNQVHSLQHTWITATAMIAFLNNKGNVTRLVLFPHPIPITRLERRWPTLGGGSVIKIDEAIWVRRESVMLPDRADCRRSILCSSVCMKKM